MTNFVLLMNILSVLATTPNTSFTEIVSHTSLEERNILIANNIDDWNDYYSYLQVNQMTNPDVDKGSVSKSITDVEKHLESNYSDYHWIKDDSRCGLTSDVSNAIPIEMKSDEFKIDEIEEAIRITKKNTTYGGCGPIAAMGILDYFSRYLGYKEIIADPTDSTQRTNLAIEVLEKTHISLISYVSGLIGEDFTLVWPWDTAEAFNAVIKKQGLNNVISAQDHWTLTTGRKSAYLNKIVDNIDMGLPVTLFTGLNSGDGPFAKHYTNIYGYETWVGIPEVGQRIEKTFIKARLNFGESNEHYCDADILDTSQIGLITYKVNYANSNDFYAYDFAEEFVNDSGGGQYFFYSKYEPVSFTNGKSVNTDRLRCSYIENEYLVLSPNRSGAGSAYIDIEFQHSVSKLSVDLAMWSSLEGAINENLKVQYMSATEWKDQKSINPHDDLPALRDNPKRFTLLFPKNTRRIRFFATHNNPSGDRNKGRIILDNFSVEYN